MCIQWFTLFFVFHISSHHPRRVCLCLRQHQRFMNLNEAVARVEAPACLGWKPSWKIKESSSFVFLRQVTLAAHSLVHVNETKRKVSREANIQRMAWMPLLPSFAGKAAKKRLRTELSAGEAKAGENPVPLTMQMHKSSQLSFLPKTAPCPKPPSLQRSHPHGLQTYTPELKLNDHGPAS